MAGMAKPYVPFQTKAALHPHVYKLFSYGWISINWKYINKIPGANIHYTENIYINSHYDVMLLTVRGSLSFPSHYFSFSFSCFIQIWVMWSANPSHSCLLSYASNKDGEPGSHAGFLECAGDLWDETWLVLSTAHMGSLSWWNVVILFLLII